LWANAFLLNKPQYFLTHTYEGRRNTPLRGEWALDGSLVTIRLPGSDSVQVDPHYSLIKVGSPYHLSVGLGAGWYAPEQQSRSTLRWQWTSGDAMLLITNPQARPLRLSLS